MKGSSPRKALYVFLIKIQIQRTINYQTCIAALQGQARSIRHRQGHGREDIKQNYRQHQ